MSQAKTARIVRIFVSSPADTARERETLEDVVRRVNRGTAAERSLRLELFRWESDVVPQIGKSPQQVIDEQTPNYDVYIGIMSSRFGTPTSAFGSGTEHEFRDAVAQWSKVGRPWILFYFNNHPRISHQPVDVEHYLKVCMFRQELESLGIVGSYSEVRGTGESFEEKVERDLQALVERIDLPGDAREKPERTESTQTLSAIPREYLNWLQAACEGVDLLMLHIGQSVRLQDIYIPLTTRNVSLEERVESNTTSRKGTAVEPAHQLLLNQLGETSLYVSGVPGTGKSVFCRWLAWLTCNGTMPSAEPSPSSALEESFPNVLRNRLPVLIRLRELWNYLPRAPQNMRMSRSDMSSALQRWIELTSPHALDWNCLADHLESGATLLILDGVDEVPLSLTEQHKAFSPRATLIEGLAQSLPSWIEAGNRVVVTGRPYAIGESDLHRLKLKPSPIDELGSHAQELLTHRWCRLLIDEPAQAKLMARDLLDVINARTALSTLASNPMLLTAMVIIFFEGKRLPQDKYDCYSRLVDNMLANRYSDPAISELVQSRLAVIAYGMHTGEALGESRTAPETEATLSEIDIILQSYRDQASWSDATFRSVVEIREQLLSQSGLLLARDNNHAAFYHISFQEYFAAQRLDTVAHDDLISIFRKRASVPEWRNTLSFLFGAQLSRRVSPDRAVGVLQQLIQTASPKEVGTLVLIADCAQLLLQRGIRLQEEYEESFRQHCLAAIDNEVYISERVSLAKALGYIGDPRLVDDLRDPEGYCVIPAGSYIGSRSSDSITFNAPVHMSRYLVTNSQYDLFLQEGGYQNSKYWSENGWRWMHQHGITKPLFWLNARWNAPNQPVVGVSFWEAEAFANWAGGRLPIIDEWRAAVVGETPRRFPWGNEWEDGICNSMEAGIGETTPVGVFPRSKSVFGHEDLFGNVRQWCSDATAQTDESDMICAVCGCSWFTPALACVIDNHFEVPANWRSELIGFRVIRTLNHE